MMANGISLYYANAADPYSLLTMNCDGIDSKPIYYAFVVTLLQESKAE